MARRVVGGWERTIFEENEPASNSFDARPRIDRDNNAVLHALRLSKKLSTAGNDGGHSAEPRISHIQLYSYETNLIGLARYCRY